ncbi:MAG: DUF6909 family protein [Candidatus Dormibacterales bacterium]
MERRAMPSGWSGRHAVELYVRTYTTMLQSSGEIRVEALQQAHIGMESALHPLAADPRSDMGALLYSIRRLPEVITRCRRVVLGQGPETFRDALGEDILAWQKVEAPARRRRWYHDGAGTLAVMIASHSDIDDLVPVLVAYQIEWNKLHRALSASSLELEQARESAGAEKADWERLKDAWGPSMEANLGLVRAAQCDITLRMIGGTHVGFARSADRWWEPISACMAELGLLDAPVYFVSSNIHSLVNVLSGVAHQLETDIREFVREADPELFEEVHKLEAGISRASYDNWLYFAARILFDHHPEVERYRRERVAMEAEVGIRHIPARTGVESAAQIFKLSRLDPQAFDRRVGRVDALALRASEAAIVNIDYPLGLTAYHLLRQAAEHVGRLAGVYVMGKAATLNADVGDVMIPDVVYNEHSGNTYWLDNAFSAADVQPHLAYGSALDNQRAVTVRGTFLQNREYLDFYYRGRYTIVEMEAGPFLDGCFEASRSERHPTAENVNMARLPFDLGVVHYASDTPYTQARTLGARGLSYRGMDSTYASAVAVARRILAQEGALLA